MTKPSSRRLWVCALVLGVFVYGSTMGVEASQQGKPAQGAPAVTSSPAPQSQDCLAIGGFAGKEKCFATSDDFKDCPQTDGRCWPYRKMYVLEQDLEQLNGELVSLSAKKYASYHESDPAYLTDLGNYLRASDAAWRSYRDKDCYLEQYVQGMSRQEIPDVVEACRVEKTQDRIKDLKELIGAVK